MHEFSKQIAAAIKSHYGNIECVDGENLCELEKWSCIIKNLTEFDKNVKIIEAMDKEEKETEMMEKMGALAGMEGPMGYNSRRYPSSGRYAPAGRGVTYGFTKRMPYLYEDDDGYMDGYLHDPNFEQNMKYGYHPSNAMGYGQMHGIEWNAGDGTTDKGRSYENYKIARRHYSDNHTQENKEMMERKISDVFDDMEAMTAEMIHDMDPAAKEKYKRRLQEIMQKMQ